MFFYTPENDQFNSCSRPNFDWRQSGLSQEALKKEAIITLNRANKEGYGDETLEDTPLSVCYPDALIDWLSDYLGEYAGNMTVTEALQHLTTSKHRNNPIWRRNTDAGYGGDQELRTLTRAFQRDPSEENRARLNIFRERCGMPYIYSLEHLEDERAGSLGD